MKKLLIFIFALFILLAGSLERLTAKVYIDIRSPSFRKFPIAIEPFASPDLPQPELKLGERATEILNSDLNLCGFFSILDFKELGPKGPNSSSASEPSPQVKNIEEAYFQKIAQIGAEALIQGEITYKNNALTIEARLYDVVKKELIVGKRYIGEISDLSRMMHRFANEVVLALTGEPSFFQTKIVFVSALSGHKEIYLMDFDGRNQRQLTKHQSICLSPRFSPEGERIVFTSYKMGNPDLYLKDLRNGEEKRISHFPGLNISPAWSPDGKRLALTLSKDGNPEIYLMNIDGSGLTRLTDHPAIDVSPSWSPDGKKLAFVSNRGGTPQIYLLDLAGKEVQRLTFEGKYNTHPTWSPRGDLIAFDSLIDNNHNICVIRPDGNGFRILTANMGRCESPSWSPDGRHLVFSSNRDGGSHLYLINLEGTQIKKLTFSKGYDRHPYWSPRFKE